MYFACATALKRTAYAMIDMVKTFCGLGGDRKSSASPVDVKVEFHPPSVPAALEPGPYADVFSIVRVGYRRLLLRNVFDPRVARGSALDSPLVDGWNVVETVCLLLVRVAPMIDREVLCHKMDLRLLLCACVCIACKNALDWDAFSPLGATQYRKTPLAVVYHTIFERLVWDWNDLEMHARALQQNIEEFEYYVIAKAGCDLFRILNDTPTLRFEYCVLCAVGDRMDAESEALACRLRNVVSFYVYNVLNGTDEVLFELVTAPQTAEVTNALALAAIETVFDACRPQWCARLATHSAESVRLALRFVGIALRPWQEPKAPPPFDHETVTRVFRTLTQRLAD